MRLLPRASRISSTGGFTPLAEMPVLSAVLLDEVGSLKKEDPVGPEIERLLVALLGVVLLLVEGFGLLPT